jgi:ketosteroid isomerase-like protein
VTTDLEAAMTAFQTCIEERDTAGADQLLDPDYALVLVHPTRAVMPRARWISVLPDYVVHRYRVLETVLDVSDDLAVVLHRDEMSATVLGEDRSGTFVVTDVWRRGDDGWRLWRRHSTPLSAGELPGE